MKRRALVLTSESARHPFRQTLPPHVLKPLAEPDERKKADSRVILDGFATAFVATFCFIL